MFLTLEPKPQHIDFTTYLIIWHSDIHLALYTAPPCCGSQPFLSFHSQSTLSWGVVIRMILLLALHALEKVFECFDLAWESEPAGMIESKLLLCLFQQHLEHGMTKIAGGNDKPPKLRPNINSQIPFGDIGWMLRALAALLIRITTQHICQPFVDCWWKDPMIMILILASIFMGCCCFGFGANCDALPMLESLFQPHNLPDSTQLYPTIFIHF